MSEEHRWHDHRERLLAFILSRGVQPDDAEDIVQEVLTKGLVREGGAGDSARLTAWLYQVLRNAIADHWRRKRPTVPVPESLPALGPPADVYGALLGCLEPFLARLDPEDAEVLRLADAHGVPQAEVARRLGLSISGAKSRIQRARAKVREMYRLCCAVELDRRGAPVDAVSRDCDAPHEPAECEGCGARNADAPGEGVTGGGKN